jgi:hypothetical protein
VAVSYSAAPRSSITRQKVTHIRAAGSTGAVTHISQPPKKPDLQDIDELEPRVADSIEAHFEGLEKDWHQGVVSFHSVALLTVINNPPCFLIVQVYFRNDSNKAKSGVPLRGSSFGMYV